MGQAYVIKKLKKKGIRIIELLSHGYIRIDGAMLTYNRWKVAFEKITIPKNISIKKKKQYFAAMDELREYYLDWMNDPEAAEAKFKKAEAKKIADAKAKAKAKKADEVKASKAKSPTVPKGTLVNLEDLKKVGEAKKS